MDARNCLGAHLWPRFQRQERTVTGRSIPILGIKCRRRGRHRSGAKCSSPAPNQDPFVSRSVPQSAWETRDMPQIHRCSKEPKRCIAFFLSLPPFVARRICLSRNVGALLREISVKDYKIWWLFWPFFILVEVQRSQQTSDSEIFRYEERPHCCY